ncbi:MAG TPA: SDR family oxidoreductase [Bdellovibrionota bacterium]|nr:SDR family oxidoreductase [Bdellovibrionota bacterium]
MAKLAAVLVTGSSGGIGAELVKALRANQTFVIGLDNKAPKAEGPDLFVSVDLADSASLEAALTRVESEIKQKSLHLRSIINNAAYQVVAPLDVASEDAWLRSYRVNTWAPVRIAQRLRPHLGTQGEGSVINVLSIHEKLTKEKFGAYAASKAALASVTRTMALEWSRELRIFGVAPAAIDTPMLRQGFEDAGRPEGLRELNELHPTARIGTPSELSVLLNFLIFEAPSFMSGSIVPFDGGIGGKLYDPA